MASWRCWSATSGRDGVSPEDLADVYRSTYRALVRFLYRKVWDAERAEDLAQEAFARALVHKPENARGWLFVDERAGKRDRKSTRLNSSHDQISYAVFCLKKKKDYSNKPMRPRLR